MTVVLTTDEETGSPTARGADRGDGRGDRAALVLEPSAGGALKTERKGVSALPDRSARTRRARRARSREGRERGGRARASGARDRGARAARSRDDGRRRRSSPRERPSNTVPAEASSQVDVRVANGRRGGPRRAAARCAPARHARHVGPTWNAASGIPPLERRRLGALFERAQELAAALGLPPLREASVGGGSDGNLLAALGVPVLDGLGAVGDHAHGEGEYVDVVRARRPRGARRRARAGSPRDERRFVAAPTARRSVWPRRTKRRARSPREACTPVSRRLRIDDLTDFALPEQPALSPDATQMRLRAARESTRTRTGPFGRSGASTSPTGEPRRLTRGPATRRPPGRPTARRSPSCARPTARRSSGCCRPKAASPSS